MNIITDILKMKGVSVETDDQVITVMADTCNSLELSRHIVNLTAILKEYLDHPSADGKQPIRKELRNKLKEYV